MAAPQNSFSGTHLAMADALHANAAKIDTISNDIRKIFQFLRKI
jgi:hypothetical protein